MDIYSKAKVKLDITDFNEMQEKAFHMIPSGQDTILLSLTGSGKTIAFLLPIMDQVDPSENIEQILIIAPTRELAQQINSVVSNLAMGFNATCCYGGHPVRFEKKALESKPTIITGTPGRILDHLERGNIDPLSIQFLVLDEFDKTLEMGFHKQMQSIIEYLRYKPQYILTSATKGLEIPSFVPLLDAQVLDFVKEKDQGGLTYYEIPSPSKDKVSTLLALILKIGDESTFVFVNFRESAQRIREALLEKGLQCDIFHGGLDQVGRENVLSKFRNGSTRILITTDLAGRGLDIPQVKNIVHYHMPIQEEIFIHRNGRTARMNNIGNVYVISHPEDKLPFTLPPMEEPLDLVTKKIKAPDWVTIKISKGTRDKIRKIDIVGFLLKIGSLSKDDLGLVEVKEAYSLAAVRFGKADEVVKRTKHQKVKGKKAIVSVLD